MRIDIISVLPELIESPFNASILKRAIDKQIIEICFHDLKKYASNKAMFQRSVQSPRDKL